MLRTFCIFTLVLFMGNLTAEPLILPVPVVAESAWEQAENLKRNQSRLRKLQSAAKACSGMRVVLAESAEARVRRPVEIARLSAREQEEIRTIIERLQAIKSAPAGEFAIPYVVSLELLGKDGKVLAAVDYLDAAPEGLVSGEGYAAGSRYKLAGTDASAWHLLLRADYARQIAANPAPTRLRSRPPRLYKMPAPPEPDPSPAFDPHAGEYFHYNCKDKHRGHKHKKSNHYCDHPQKH